MGETMKIYKPGTLMYDSYTGTRFTVKKDFNSVVDDLKKYDDELKARQAKISKKPSHVKESKWKFFFDANVWKDVIHENAQREEALNQKHPWVEILYRWTIALCVVLLFVSFIFWGISVYTERTAQAYAASEVEKKEAEHQAFLAQMEADKIAEQESIENVMKSNAQAKARLGYGSRNFIEKYHYGDSDFMTLYQCVDNRLKNSMYTGMTIEDIVYQDGQFISSYSTNPVQDYYFNLAMKSERAKQNQISEPVGSDYVYAIYTPHGIFLANDPKAPAYTWWHYSE